MDEEYAKRCHGEKEKRITEWFEGMLKKYPGIKVDKAYRFDGLNGIRLRWDDTGAWNFMIRSVVDGSGRRIDVWEYDSGTGECYEYSNSDDLIKKYGR